MKGPTPKAAAIRQRRNRSTTQALLTMVEEVSGRAPTLPKHRAWHKMTRAWWKDVWASPMAAEYLAADKHGLFILAELVDRFWRVPSITLSAEIRKRGEGFGLTPIDRRRLQWEVERVEAIAPRSPIPPTAPDEDPRRLLRVVS